MSGLGQWMDGITRDLGFAATSSMTRRSAGWMIGRSDDGITRGLDFAATSSVTRSCQCAAGWMTGRFDGMSNRGLGFAATSSMTRRSAGWMIGRSDYDLITVGSGGDRRIVRSQRIRMVRVSLYNWVDRYR